MYISRDIVQKPSLRIALTLLLGAASLAWPSSQACAQTLNQPAQGYGQFLTGGTPALTTFNSSLYLAYGGASDGLLYVASSSTGLNFTSATQVSAASVGSSPAPFEYNNTLYIFYRDASDGTIKQVSSIDGVNFTSPIQLQYNGGSVYSTTPVSVAYFGSNFYVVYTDSEGYVEAAATDGQTVFSSSVVSYNYTTANAPSVVQGDSQLVVAFQAGNHMLVMEGSYDGVNWNETPYPGILMGSGPNVTLYNGAEFYVTFQSNDKYHVLFQTTGYSPASLQTPAIVYYNNIKIGSAPSCAQNLALESGYTLFCGFKSNDQYNWTFVARGN